MIIKGTPVIDTRHGAVDTTGVVFGPSSYHGYVLVEYPLFPGKPFVRPISELSIDPIRTLIRQLDAV